MQTIEQRAADWLSGNDTGVSSKALCRHMLGLNVADNSAPSDGADLGRCLRLLKLIPEWTGRITEMADLGYCWAALVPHWSELEELLRAEAGDDYRGLGAPKTYDRISALTKDARSKDGWISFGDGCSIRVGV